MKKYKDEKITAIFCNKCGRQLRYSSDVAQEGVCSVNVNWGYFSNKDGERHKFDLCENCYDDITAEFSICVEIEEQTEIL